jgi:hypothetical protein
VDGADRNFGPDIVSSGSLKTEPRMATFFGLCPMDQGPRTKDLWTLGFFRNNGRHTLLVKFADGGLHKAALDPANRTYTTGGGEASFRIRQ